MPEADAMPTTPTLEQRQNFRWVCIALTCTFIVHSMLLVTVPVHAVELGASPVLMGLIFSAPYLLPLVLAIPMGGAVTRIGGRAAMASGAALMVVGLALILGVMGYSGLILGQLFFGVAQLLMVLAAQTIISSLGTRPVLEGYFGWYTTWLSGGQILGPLMAGGLIQTAGQVEYAYVAMLVIAVASLITSLSLAGAARRGQIICPKDLIRARRS